MNPGIDPGTKRECTSFVPTPNEYIKWTGKGALNAKFG